MYSYDEFIAKCKTLGLDPFEFLMPKEAFEDIDEEADYTTKDIGFFLNKSERTIRRRFAEGKIEPSSVNPWLAKGISVKRMLFDEFSRPIIKRFEGRKNIL